MMLKPRDSKSFSIALNNGISERQGMHQVAQKFNSTTRPRKSFSRRGLPSSLVNCTSGAEAKFCFVSGGGGGGVSSPGNLKNDWKLGRNPANRPPARTAKRLPITSTPTKIR